MAALRRRGAASGDRRGTPADFLVVGLGNPGSEYERSRHNVGFEVIDRLAGRFGAQLRRTKFRALADEVTVGDHRVALATPQTFMNDSGEAVASLVRRFGIDDLQRLVVVHDELDLPIGRVKVKKGGGLAGHNGLRSIRAHLHDDGFVRVRIGVGKPPTKEAGADHVLRRPSKSERDELDITVVEAADAVDLLITDGLEAAMGQANRR